MRQYTDQKQSGTVTSSTRKEVDKLTPIIDRVMMVANRLAKAEKELNRLTNKIGDFESTIKAQDYKIKMQDEKINELTSDAPKVATPPRRKPVAKKTTTKTN